MALAFHASAQTSSSISGTVKDLTGAVVPGAKVVLSNQASKATRSMNSNGDGFFFFAGVPPATYNVEISYKNFETWEVTGITVHPGDNLTIPKINLQPGAVTMSVTVTADTAGVSLSSGEHSTLITADQIKRLSTVGRDANELISMLPGFSVVSGGIDNTGADYQTMGFGTGNLNSFSANGSAPQQGAVNVTSDGANLIDPGDMGGQISNVNMEQVQEVKVQTSNFGADQAKGPIVISAVGKSGSSEFHGSLYANLRNYKLNSNEWISNKDGVGRAETKYLYPGGSFGGPVLIPGTRFNQSKRLVFWTGYEYYRQNNLNGLETAFVPLNGKANADDPTGTLNMLAGDFSESTIAHALNVDPAGLQANCDITSQPTGSTSTQWETYLNVAGVCSQPTGFDQADHQIVNGFIPPADWDKGVGAYTRFWPTPNHKPRPVTGASGTASQSEGFNWVNNNVGTSNGFQFHSRVDENISDSLKLYVTYNWEKVNSTNNTWSTFDYNVASSIPIPTPFDSHSRAQYLTLNLVKTIGTSITNEFTASGVLFKQPAQYENRSLVEDAGTPWASAGYSGGVTPQLMYGSGTTKKKLDQNFLPGVGGWETGANVPSFAAAYVSAQTGQFINKYSWNVTDNLTKVYKTHSLKAGFYAEQTANNSATLGSLANGAANYMHWGGCYVNQLVGNQTTSGTPDKIGTGNEFGQFLNGCPLGYSQTNLDPNNNLRFSTIEGYVTDEWKVKSKLTVTAGIRLSHIGPWTDRHGVGIAVWEPSLLTQHVQLTTLTSDPKTWTGFKWHQIDSSIPVAGVPTRPLFYSPRFSLAYDLRGNGKTVFRGGWGAYHSHDSTAYASGASTPLGLMGWQMSSTGSNNCTYAQMFNPAYVPCGAYQSGSYSTSQTYVGPSAFQVNANDPHDDRMPVTYTYNFTVDQSMPWKMQAEVAYVGNQSSSLSTLGNLQNQNVIPIGSYYGLDPITNQVNPVDNIQNSGADYRPYPNYSQVDVPSHKAWGNYNGLQASLNKQAGSLIFGVNYTWSKTLAVRGNWDTGAIGDPLDMNHDYGITSFNRPSVINGNYSWQEGTKIHGNRILAGVVNGWEVSGVITLQAGPDLPVLSGNNFGFGGNATYYTTAPNGTVTKTIVGIGSGTWLGSGDYALQPTVTCDPRSGLKKNQFVNGNCFGLPAQGTEGTWNLPYTPGPKYFKWDMTVNKDIKISDRQNMQFRFAGFNFLNHPITSFSGQDPSNPLTLQVADDPNSHWTTLQDALNNAKVANPNIFGGTIYKRGQRILELGLKYNF
jgi:hypothetical protein